jgi:hypothetical protein
MPPPLQPSYINYMDAQHGPDPMLSYYAANSGWLQEMKARMDPTGYFSAHPLAIPPAAGPLPPGSPRAGWRRPARRQPRSAAPGSRACTCVSSQ